MAFTFVSNVTATRSDRTYLPVSVEPISIEQFKLDDAAGYNHDMDTPLSDPCPHCKGSMTVGSWVCWGFCFPCFDKLDAEARLEA